MIRFKAYGHENIKCSHANTLEFTKESDVNPSGTCIIGVKADFDSRKLKDFVKDKQKVTMLIHVNSMTEKLEFIPNPDFDDEEEIVVRKSGFESKRTLGFRADKSADDFSDEFREKLADAQQEIMVELR